MPGLEYRDRVDIEVAMESSVVRDEAVRIVRSARARMMGLLREATTLNNSLLDFIQEQQRQIDDARLNAARLSRRQA